MQVFFLGQAGAEGSPGTWRMWCGTESTGHVLQGAALPLLVFFTNWEHNLGDSPDSDSHCFFWKSHVQRGALMAVEQ